MILTHFTDTLGPPDKETRIGFCGAEEQWIHVYLVDPVRLPELTLRNLRYHYTAPSCPECTRIALEKMNPLDILEVVDL